MKKVDEIRLYLDELKEQIINSFNEQINVLTEISFIDNDLTENEFLEQGLETDLTYFEFINRKGDIVECRLLSISKDKGLKYVKDDCTMETGYIGFRDLHNLDDMLNVLELIEGEI